MLFNPSPLGKWVGLKSKLQRSLLLFCNVLEAGDFSGDVRRQAPSIMTYQGPLGRKEISAVS